MQSRKRRRPSNHTVTPERAREPFLDYIDPEPALSDIEDDRDGSPKPTADYTTEDDDQLSV